MRSAEKLRLFEKIAWVLCIVAIVLIAVFSVTLLERYGWYILVIAAIILVIATFLLVTIFQLFADLVENAYMTSEHTETVPGALTSMAEKAEQMEDKIAAMEKEVDTVKKQNEYLINILYHTCVASYKSNQYLSQLCHNADQEIPVEGDQDMPLIVHNKETAGKYILLMGEYKGLKDTIDNGNVRDEHKEGIMKRIEELEKRLGIDNRE